MFPVRAGSHAGGPLSRLELQVPLRPYQAHVLDALTTPEAAADHRHHVIAPPGSGKTLIGLELARRLGRPTVVFAPTTTIARQWFDELRLFLDGASAPGDIASLDPARPALVTILTYQVLSTTARPGAALRGLAVERWQSELVADDRCSDLDAARERIAQMAAANPQRHRRELRRRAAAVRREVLREGDPLDVGPHLHANARALVDRLVAAGVSTLVLDECHHLFDHWAIVLRHLVARLRAAAPDPDAIRTIGLTATPPTPGSSREAENHAALVGPVDHEVPLPAVVRSGELAPYADLVTFTRPTRREVAFLRRVDEAFRDAVAEVTTGEAFVRWVVATAVGPALATRSDAALSNDQAVDAFAAWIVEQPDLALAALRVLRQLKVALPVGVPEPEEAAEPPTVEDWAALLERWGLDVLALSADPDDHAQLARLRDVLRPFGLTLTERGLRQSRPVGDVVLALSASKDAAVVDLLAAEHADLGDRLRALVVTDVDRRTTAIDRTEGTLDEDAGSARRLFRALAADHRTRALAPVLCTGRVVWATGEHAVELAAVLGGPDLLVQAEPTAHPHVWELSGEGSLWSPRTWVPALTAAYADGDTRCLVGTRALFGEGWDAPSCNTLIDLTGVTTETAALQLRGRVLRLDPSCPGKVAHVWDVVCVHDEHERGDRDLARLRRRHAGLWGVVEEAGPPPAPIVRGIGHLDPALLGPDDHLDLEDISARARAQISRRARTRAAWAVGSPYEDRVRRRMRLVATRRSTVATVAAVRRRQAALLPAATTGILALLSLVGLVEPLLGIGLAAAAAFTALVWLRPAVRDVRRARTDGSPLPEVIADVARALVTALASVDGMGVNGSAPAEPVVTEVTAGTVEVVADPSASEAAAEALVTAVGQALGPTGRPRYLIAWRPPGHDHDLYSPVPDALGGHRDRAEALLAAWNTEVGRARLVYVHSDEGRTALLRARAQRALPVRELAWRTWT